MPKKTKKKPQPQTPGLATETVVKSEKKKKYERRVRVKMVPIVCNVLVYNSKNFRANYDGDGMYIVRVLEEDAKLLDELIVSLEK